MHDKIKIRVSNAILSSIDEDCDKFEIYKNDGKINRNALLTRLIVNYTDKIQNLTNKSKDISPYIFHNDETNYDKTLSIQPTKESEKNISYIETCLLQENTLSGFIRYMVISYLSLSQVDREKIIFRKETEEVFRSINEKKQLFIQARGKKSYVISPYALVSSKEEMHNYLLAKTNEGYRSYRLNRIASVKTLDEVSIFSKEDKMMFERMQKYGPQYHYELDEEPVLVKLTDKGKILFHDLYVHRPICDSIQDDVYEFKGSHVQIVFYFSRFGKEAYIVSPNDVRKELYYFYKESFQHYQKIYIEEQINIGAKKK